MLKLKMRAAESLPEYEGGPPPTVAHHSEAVISAIRQECEELRESVLEVIIAFGLGASFLFAAFCFSSSLFLRGFMAAE